MSVHRSLKTRNALERHRNVLSRAERIKALKEHEKWEDGRSVFGLPKVAHRKAAVGGKTKKAAAATVEGAEAAAAAGAPGAPAAAAEPAKEAKGKEAKGKEAKGKDKK